MAGSSLIDETAPPGRFRRVQCSTFEPACGDGVRYGLRDMFGGHESLTLRSGTTIRCGHDPTSIWIDIGWPTHELLATISLEVPECGVGGLELVASPDERFLALFLYSGQSEQGYFLYELIPDRP